MNFCFTDIPWSFATSNCRIKTSIKHLINDQVKCVQTIDEHDQFIAEFQSNLRSMKILRYRKPLDSPVLVMTDFCKTMQNQTENCISTEIYHCTEAITLRTCKTDTNLTIDFGESYITDDLSIQIHHNFTHIQNFTVFFVYHELDSDSFSPHITQTIRLEYLEANETFASRDVHQVSGNIGYLPHKPVIVTKFLHQNDTPSENINFLNGYLEYFHNETNCTNNDQYLKLPSVQSNGDCVLNNLTFKTIDFGENIRIKCNALLTPNAMNSTTNANENILQFYLQNSSHNNTHICRDFQLNIFDYLLHHFELENPNTTIYNRFNVRISEMGNPRNDTMHWYDFKTVHAPNLDDIVAVEQSSTGTEFTCSNMVLNVRYEFFYGTMMVGNVPNQALIKVAQIQFGNRLKLKFKLDEDALRVPLYIDVMFFDFSRIVSNNGHSITCAFLLILLSLLLELVVGT